MLLFVVLNYFETLFHLHNSYFLFYLLWLEFCDIGAEIEGTQIRKEFTLIRLLVHTLVSVLQPRPVQYFFFRVRCI